MTRTDVTPIIIVERGNCSFVRKVRNIEHAGGLAAVVVDKKMEDVEYVIMSDDGTGSGIRIPSMLIGKNDGNKLMSWLLKLGGTPTTSQKSDTPPDDDIEPDDTEFEPKSSKPSKEERENQILLEQSIIGINFNMEKPDN